MTSLEHIRDVLSRLSFDSTARRNAMDRLDKDWHCEHEHTELRVKTDIMGRAMYAYQCLRCGDKPEKWLPHAQLPPNIGQLRPIDSELRRRFLNDHADAIRQLNASFDAGGAEWWTAYNWYLETAEWRAKREKVLRRAQYQCEGCGDRPASQVHHISYAHVTDEFLWELRAVCESCHAKLHPHLREDR
jgi:hypothetical protein